MTWQLNAVDFQADDASQSFSDYVHKTGFGVLTNHPINPQLIADVYAEWEAFFHDERRFDYAFDPVSHDGYIPFDKSETAKGAAKKDLKEFFHLYLHGRYPAMLSDKTRTLMTQMIDVASTLLGWLEENTPKEIRAHFSMPLSEMIKNSPRTLFRILYYPPLTGHEEPNAVRAAAHGDINLLTLLPAATADGLQALGKDGQWHTVPTDPKYLIVNVGDMLEECAKGYYFSSIHRVINPEGEAAKQARLSSPLFLHARPEVRLSDQHSAASYWAERQKELGLDRA
ncbi:MAG: 2OG-Fe(II) oxygenase [Gammaproteobacteria bacterium CG11_big_fil_rev_8_21_14_0_20_46_22]|nr:MAG: 2OG-Fe(II) oxygenase [Gammaproteobacteria bacterium CG12_big_fil_rev_8_21_14_0_65_46_12]PIR12082.1 MAG: 2OG-Fe(II) oxygenase [Gammaproteobacteria bacterium CG11_big_fil_rev_8_21_14_0_20_46_22]